MISSRCCFLALVVSVVPGCTSSACTEVLTCPDQLTLEFQPPIFANERVEMEISGDGASYRGSYQPTLESGAISFVVETDLDAGGFLVKRAKLGPARLSTVSYSIWADGTLIVDNGSMIPRYVAVTVGSGDCAATCSQAEGSVSD